MWILGTKLDQKLCKCPETELIWACDKDTKRMDKATRPYPGVKGTADINDILSDTNLTAVAIATPVNTHFSIAKACLENGKHVLVEKPLAASVEEGEKLVRLASDKGLQLMCDHTFCYTGAVRK